MNIIKHLFNPNCPIPLSFTYTQVWVQHTSSEWSCTCYCQSGKVPISSIIGPILTLNSGRREIVWLNRPCCPKCKMKYSPLVLYSWGGGCVHSWGGGCCAQLGVCVCTNRAWQLSCSWWQNTVHQGSAWACSSVAVGVKCNMEHTYIHIYLCNGIRRSSCARVLCKL